MKKILLFIIAISLTGCLSSQITYNLVINKTSPSIHLKGLGGVINFNNSDVTLTQSSNLLTVGGGNMSLGSNSLLLTGSIGSSGAGKVSKVWMTDLEVTNSPTINGVSIATTYAPINNTTFTGTTTIPSLTLGATPITSTAAEINILHGTNISAANLSSLQNMTTNIKTQLDNKISANDAVLTGLTQVEQLKIGSGANVILDSLVVSGSGIDAYKDGAAIGFNPTTNATTDLRDVALQKHIPINAFTDSHTLELTDDGLIVTMNKSTATNLTIPLNSSVPFELGTQIVIACIGNGQTTLVATGGVTIISAGGNLDIIVKSGVTLTKIDTDTWWAGGGLE